MSVKPHASPVLHAIEYLLGQLDRKYLTTLREFGGLQSYPSRLKDPVPADFSTGSVGIGATAPIWSALAHRYVAGHFDVPQGGRQVALLGDAELDEGAIWEALVDPVVPQLGEVLWIVDLNRQSLDRIVPDIAAGRIAAMFEAAGWHDDHRQVRPLAATSCSSARAARRCARRIDEMPNEEYQRLLRVDAGELRERLPGSGRGRRDVERLVAELDDDELLRAVRDLGGHDLGDLLDALRRGRRRDRPPVGDLRLHDQGVAAADAGPSGQPLGAAVRRAVGASSPATRARTRRSVGARSPAGSPEAELCREAARGWSARAARRTRRAGACRPTSGGRTPAARRPSRRSGASSSTSRTARRRSPRAW